MNSELQRKFASAAFIVGLFLLWEVLCLVFHVSDVILPRPSQVFATMVEKAPALWPHTLQTLYTTMVGFVFGECTDCKPGDGYGSLTLEQILDHYIRPLGIPAYRGAMIGHIREQFILPVGGKMELDADAGTLRLLEPVFQG